MVDNSLQCLNAPERPGSWRIIDSRAYTSFLFLVVIVLGIGLKQPIFTVTGILGVGVSLFTGVQQWRQYEHEGWYEKRGVEVPALPFAIKKEQHITFETDAVSSQSWTGHNQIFYDQIVRVQVDYDERKMTLEGLWIHVTWKQYHSVKEKLPKPIKIQDCGDGWHTQKALAILREVAPQARFDAPDWLEEGWFPRLGMERISESHGGGP